MEKILAVLDIDETLVYATSSPKDDRWDFEVHYYRVYKRPYLTEFLDGLVKDFRVAVWSSASDDYVNEIVQRIFPKNYPLEFVWGRSQCTHRIDYQQMEITGYHDPYKHYHYVKRLSKLKRSRNERLERVLIIDDTPGKAIHNYGNVIYPKEFVGDLSDDELYWLSQYLDTLKDVENVRIIEKRGWKEEIMNQKR